MNIPQVKIDITLGKLGIQSVFSELEIEQPPIGVEVHKNLNNVEINSKNAEIHIDSSSTNYDFGYRNVNEFSREVSKKGFEAASHMAERYAREGDRMMQIEESSENEEKFVPEGIVKVGLVWVRGPEVEVNPYSISVVHNLHKPEIMFSPEYPLIDFRPGILEIYQRQSPDISMSVEERVNFMV